MAHALVCGAAPRRIAMGGGVLTAQPHLLARIERTLLDSLNITRVIVVGIAGNICVLFTANDAYMRGLRIYAPSDCIVSNSVEDNAQALRQIEHVLKGRTEASDLIRFTR